MANPARTSTRAIEKARLKNDIELDSRQTFIFYFPVDNTYMLFPANDENWPVHFLNAKKISLKKLDHVIFLKIGKGLFMNYGPLDLMVHVGEYMNSNLGDTTCDVARLDVSAVIKEVLGAVSKTSNERESQVILMILICFRRTKNKLEVIANQLLVSVEKLRKVERFQLKKAPSVPPVDKFLVRRAHLNNWRMKSSFI